MTFLSILKSIGNTVLAVEPIIGTVISAVVPATAPVMAAVTGMVTNLQASIASAEVANPVANGQVKSDAVVSDFNAGLGITNEVLAMEGKKLMYDGQALQDAINAQVAAYNAFAKLKTSFKIVPLAATT